MAHEQFGLSPEGAPITSLQWVCRFTHNAKRSKLFGEPVFTTHLTPPTAEWKLGGTPVTELVKLIGVSERYSKAHADALGIILVRVLAALAANKDINGIPSLCLSRAASSFSTPPRYRTNRVGLKAWTNAIDSLERMGFIEKLCGGFKGKGYFQGLTSTYVPSQKAIGWFSKYCFELALLRSPTNEPVVLTSDKRLIDYADDEHTSALRRQIHDINSVNQAHNFSLQRGLQVAPIDRRFLTGKRRFRDDFQSGGRLFLPLQQLKKQERAHLIIDREETVELDFSSHAPRLLFHMNGSPAPTDCYAHDSVPRGIMKDAMLRVTNCESRSMALRSLRVFLRDEAIDFLSPQELLRAVEETNPYAVKGMKPGRWKELQYLESTITCSIAHQLHEKDIPCLPIHDSFVVRRRDRDVLLDVMHEEYRKQFPRFSPVVVEAG